MSKKPESIGGLVEKIAGPPLAMRIKELEAECVRLRGLLDRALDLLFDHGKEKDAKLLQDELEWPARKSLMDRGMEP